MTRSEKLIEPGNSWFSPKQLLGWRLVYRLGVEHWKGQTGSNLVDPIKLRIPARHYEAVRLWALRSIGREGKSLDLKLRSLNLY